MPPRNPDREGAGPALDVRRLEQGTPRFAGMIGPVQRGGEPSNTRAARPLPPPGESATKTSQLTATELIWPPRSAAETLARAFRIDNWTPFGPRRPRDPTPAPPKTC
jgi:hypothetical protein